MSEVWYESRTLWATIVVFVLSMLKYFKLVPEDLDINVDASLVTTILAVIFFILRLLTSKAVTVTK